MYLVSPLILLEFEMHLNGTFMSSKVITQTSTFYSYVTVWNEPPYEFYAVNPHDTCACTSEQHKFHLVRSKTDILRKR